MSLNSNNNNSQHQQDYIKHQPTEQANIVHIPKLSFLSTVTTNSNFSNHTQTQTPQSISPNHTPNLLDSKHLDNSANKSDFQFNQPITNSSLNQSDLSNPRQTFESNTGIVAPFGSVFQQQSMTTTAISADSSFPSEQANQQMSQFATALSKDTTAEAGKKTDIKSPIGSPKQQQSSDQQGSISDDRPTAAASSTSPSKQAATGVATAEATSTKPVAAAAASASNPPDKQQPQIGSGSSSQLGKDSNISFQPQMTPQQMQQGYRQPSGNNNGGSMQNWTNTFPGQAPMQLANNGFSQSSLGSNTSSTSGANATGSGVVGSSGPGPQNNAMFNMFQFPMQGQFYNYNQNAQQGGMLPFNPNMPPMNGQQFRPQQASFPMNPSMNNNNNQSSATRGGNGRPQQSVANTTGGNNASNQFFPSTSPSQLPINALRPLQLPNSNGNLPMNLPMGPLGSMGMNMNMNMMPMGPGVGGNQSNNQYRMPNQQMSNKMGGDNQKGSIDSSGKKSKKSKKNNKSSNDAQHQNGDDVGNKFEPTLAISTPNLLITSEEHRGSNTTGGSSHSMIDDIHAKNEQHGEYDPSNMGGNGYDMSPNSIRNAAMAANLGHMGMDSNSNNNGSSNRKRKQDDSSRKMQSDKKHNNNNNNLQAPNPNMMGIVPTGSLVDDKSGSGDEFKSYGMRVSPLSYFSNTPISRSNLKSQWICPGEGCTKVLNKRSFRSLKKHKAQCAQYIEFIKKDIARMKAQQLKEAKKTSRKNTLKHLEKELKLISDKKTKSKKSIMKEAKKINKKLLKKSQAIAQGRPVNNNSNESSSDYTSSEYSDSDSDSSNSSSEYVTDSDDSQQSQSANNNNNNQHNNDDNNNDEPKQKKRRKNNQQSGNDDPSNNNNNSNTKMEPQQHDMSHVHMMSNNTHFNPNMHPNNNNNQNSNNNNNSNSMMSQHDQQQHSSLVNNKTSPQSAVSHPIINNMHEQDSGHGKDPTLVNREEEIAKVLMGVASY